jgi:hypothetical protein
MQVRVSGRGEAIMFDGSLPTLYVPVITIGTFEAPPYDASPAGGWPLILRSSGALLGHDPLRVHARVSLTVDTDLTGPLPLSAFVAPDPLNDTSLTHFAFCAIGQAIAMLGRPDVMPFYKQVASDAVDITPWLVYGLDRSFCDFYTSTAFSWSLTPNELVLPAPSLAPLLGDYWAVAPPAAVISVFINGMHADSMPYPSAYWFPRLIHATPLEISAAVPEVITIRGEHFGSHGLDAVRAWVGDQECALLCRCLCIQLLLPCGPGQA